MKKIIHAIRARKIHFLWIFIATFMLFHIPWVTFILCNFNESVRATESDPLLVVFATIVLPLIITMVLGFFAYFVYSKSTKRWMVYICPLLFLVILLVLSLQLAFTDLGLLIFCSVLVGLYVLEIFLASSLAAPFDKRLNIDKRNKKTTQ